MTTIKAGTPVEVTLAVTRPGQEPQTITGTVPAPPRASARALYDGWAQTYVLIDSVTGGDDATVEIVASSDRKLVGRVFEYIAPKITISLIIENAYELYDHVTTYVVDRPIPAPPTLDEDAEEYSEWALDHIHPLTGVGHEDGDSWYDVLVTACSEPALVGRTFEWGY